MNSILLKPEINELYTLNEFVLNELKKEDLKVNLIVEEIFANIINYSQTDYIKVNIKFEKPILTIEFIDNGMEFNPLKKENPEPPENIEDAQIGGVGVFLIKEIADELYYSYTNGENHLKIIKNVE
ncbi:MAG: ATP-binding protein [Methanobrevibacter sp.]|uniref:ATP-binding protein n=1 Tax=Methanobrevibacter sp. TaxID=66852 RepID=UPI001DBDA095|nr:ATP-binding protein [Methanobrevibacter sp.]MBE6489824.1 ATP-binding protein [Methanobrevibacter sp.]MEE0900907.1 ATP-binding protein [Methanobrevibacter sp.]MEE0935919.1 ATP-binding protein [Methanobrevibacter sp.]